MQRNIAPIAHRMDLAGTGLVVGVERVERFAHVAGVLGMVHTVVAVAGGMEMYLAAADMEMRLVAVDADAADKHLYPDAPSYPQRDLSLG